MTIVGLVAGNRQSLKLVSGLFVCGLAALPLIVQDRYYLHIFVTLFLYAYLGSCWDILGGYTGQVCFGPALFFGIGGYTSSLLLISYGLTPWIGMIVGGLAAVIVALLMGYLCFRFGLRGLYFAITTIFFAEMFRILSTNYAPGQAQGIQLPFKGNSFYFFQFIGAVPYYYLSLGLVLGIWCIVYKIERSKLGYYLIAIREDEQMAETLRINTMKYKLIAISLSAFLTALGGTFYSQYVLFIDPTLAFGLGTSTEIIIRPIAGGMGILYGPFMGSLVITPVAEITRRVVEGFSGLHLVFYGLILIAVILLMPSGLAGWIEQARKRRRIGTLVETRA